MDGLPVIIRLIDPPLHEFMPEHDEIFAEVIEMRVKGQTDGLAEKEALLAAIESMHESNPMMGHARCSPEHDDARHCQNAGTGHL